MQDELTSEYPDKSIQIVGVNEFGHESGNSLMASEGDAPILQDLDDDGNSLSDVWRDNWDVTYRDVKIVNQQNELVGTLNLTPPGGFNLAEPANYAALKRVLVDVAHERPLWQNPEEPTDVNNDQRTSAVDAIQCINELALGTVSGSGIDLPLPMPPTMPNPYLDVNGDGRITANDAIRVINRLIEQSSASEGELLVPASTPMVAEGELTQADSQLAESVSKLPDETSDERSNPVQDVDGRAIPLDEELADAIGDVTPVAALSAKTVDHVLQTDVLEVDAISRAS